MMGLIHARLLAFTGGDGISDGAAPGAELKLLARDDAGLGKRNDTSTDDGQATGTSDPATADSGSLSSAARPISSAPLESTEPTSVESVAVPSTTASLPEPISTDSAVLVAAPSTSPEPVPSTTTDSAAAAPSTVLPSASVSSSDPISASVSDSAVATPSSSSDPAAAATSTLASSSSSDSATPPTSTLDLSSSSDPAAAATSTLASSSADLTSDVAAVATSSAPDLSSDITSAVSSTLALDSSSGSASELASSIASDAPLDAASALSSAATAAAPQVTSDSTISSSAAPVVSDPLTSKPAASDPTAPNSIASPPTASTTAKPGLKASVSPSVSEPGVSASDLSKSTHGSEQATLSPSSSNSISKPIFSEFQQGLAPTAAAELADPTSFLTATRTGQSGVFVNPSADPTNTAGFNVTQINRPTEQVNATIAASVIGAVAGIIGLGILVTFIMRRYFRAHRLGKAESPPSSPLLNGFSSTLPPPGSTRDNLSWLNGQRADHGDVGREDFDEKALVELKGHVSPMPGRLGEEGGASLEVRGWRALSLFPTRGKAAEGRVVPHDF